MTATTRSLKGAIILMSGGSRGIGLAILERAARDGANVVILAKTDRPDPRLEGTVHTAVEHLEAAGGQALAVVGDVRSDDDVERAVQQAADRFGGIDIVINNASALVPLPTEELTPKQYDLMQDINTRGTFMLTRAALPYLRQSKRPDVLTLSPPLNLTSQYWLGKFPGYLLSKYGMSLATIAFAAEFADAGIRVNGLWPKTTIATDAVKNILGGDEALNRARSPQIVADAAHAVLTSPDRLLTGKLLIDEDILRDVGVTDFTQYRLSESDAALELDFFLEDPEGV